MQTPTDTLAATAFERACKKVYINGGLMAFLGLAKSYEPSTTIGFDKLIYYAIHHFGIKATDMADELKFSKAAISGWVNHGVCPSLYDRQAVKDYLVKHLQEQITLIVCGPEE